MPTGQEVHYLKVDVEGLEEAVLRGYADTVEMLLARELTIEFDLHATGPAARWAAQAQPGQRATIAGPRGSFVIAPDHDWHLLVGDETASVRTGRIVPFYEKTGTVTPNMQRRIVRQQGKPKVGAELRHSSQRMSGTPAVAGASRQLSGCA